MLTFCFLYASPFDILQDRFAVRPKVSGFALTVHTYACRSCVLRASRRAEDEGREQVEVALDETVREGGWADQLPPSR